MGTKTTLKGSGEGSFVKYKYAYVPSEQYFIVFIGDHIMEKDLSEDEACKLCLFLNSHEYLSTDSKIRSARAQPMPDFDFESIYEIYPRHEGKTKGIAKLKKTIKSIEQYNLLRLAVENYASQRLGEDPKYTKLFSSFVSCWNDYLPETVVNSDSSNSFSIDDITKLVQD